MSNSPLVNYTRISPNRTSPRNHAIDTITIHCVVGQLSVETLGNVFAPTSRQASSNYGVGPDGRIGMYVEEKDRSWCTSSASNDNRAVTIEVASNTSHPYAVTDAAYEGLIRLVADICKRNGIKKLLWKGNKSLIGQVSLQNMTVHRWFANKSCPGDYLYNRHSDIANRVNAILNSSASDDKPAPSGNTTYVGKGIGSATAKTSMSVRSGSNTSAAKVGDVAAGKKVEVLQILANGWYKIVWPGVSEGFAFTSNVNNAYYTYTPNKSSPVSGAGNTKYSGTGIGTATAKTDMAVRSKNTTIASQIGTVKSGKKVEVLQIMSNGWYKIVWPGASDGLGYTSNVNGAYYTYVPNK